MPETAEEQTTEAEQVETPSARRSASFNSMREILERELKPFHEASKEPPTEEPKPKTAPSDAKKPALPVKPVEEKQPDVSAPVQQPDPAKEEELPESIRKSPKASEEFKKIRTSAHQFKAEAEKHAAQIKSLEEELGKLKAAPLKPAALPPEFESIKKERDELSEQLKAVSIERHPSFRTHFESRTTAAVEKAKASIGPEITDKAVKLAQLPPSEYRTEQLDKLLTEAQETSPSRAAFLSDLIRDVNAISYDRESALKKARDDYEVVQKHEADKAEALKAEQLKARDAFTAQALELAKGLEAFKRTDDPKVNAAVTEREEFVKALIRGEVEEKYMAFIPVLAKEAEYLRETVLPSLREENAKLLKQIAEMTQSNPRPGETGGKPAEPSPQAGRGFISRYMANKPQT